MKTPLLYFYQSFLKLSAHLSAFILNRRTSVKARVLSLIKSLSLLFLTCFFCLSWTWKDFSITLEPQPELKVKTDWVVDTVRQGGLRPNLTHNSPPLIQDELVVQGNAIDGVKAYHKETGKQIWDFNIPSGAASPLVFHKENIYFGGADGFFYSLQLKSGLLNWKYFSGRENSGPPVIHDNTIYWLADNQTVYALDLQGSLLWTISVGALSQPAGLKTQGSLLGADPSPAGNFLVRGTARPVVYKDTLYAGFSKGLLAALNKKTGQLKWKRSFSQPIIEDLRLHKKALLVPVFHSHLFCLSFSNGKTLWKLKGGSSVQQTGLSNIYQFSKGRLYAFKGKKLKWKKQIKASYLFPPVVVKNYLIYGSSSQNDLTILNSKDGQYVGRHHFGKGLAAPISVQGNDIYFLSVSGYLHKLTLN